MTRCPKCGNPRQFYEGYEMPHAGCPWPGQPTPAPSLLDFAKATEAMWTSQVPGSTPRDWWNASRAALNAQAAALVETAVKAERKKVLREVYDRWLVASSEEVDDFIEWLTNERPSWPRFLSRLEARDDHR